MGQAKRQYTENQERLERMCDRCEKRPKTRRCRWCDQVTLCAWCAADLFDGAICPDCENRREKTAPLAEDMRWVR
jgi:hypothetical protein